MIEIQDIESGRAVLQVPREIKTNIACIQRGDLICVGKDKWKILYKEFSSERIKIWVRHDSFT